MLIMTDAGTQGECKPPKNLKKKTFTHEKPEPLQSWSSELTGIQSPEPQTQDPKQYIQRSQNQSLKPLHHPAAPTLTQNSRHPSPNHQSEPSGAPQQLGAGFFKFLCGVLEGSSSVLQGFFNDSLRNSFLPEVAGLESGN